MRVLKGQLIVYFKKIDNAKARVKLETGTESLEQMFKDIEKIIVENNGASLETIHAKLIEMAIEGSYHTNSACMHISSISDQANEYCGRNVQWNDVLDDIAFQSIENHSTDTYIINSEPMQTCWFVNKTALKPENQFLSMFGKIPESHVVIMPSLS